MEYALLIYGDEKVWASRTDEEGRAHSARHEKFATALQQRGALRGGQKLALPGQASTTLRRNGDDVSVTDGPFAETTEVLGGFYVVEADDLDAAIEIAKGLPEEVVEVRPIAAM